MQKQDKNAWPAKAIGVVRRSSGMVRRDRMSINGKAKRGRRESKMDV